MLDAFFKILPNILVTLIAAVGYAYIAKWLWTLSLILISFLPFSKQTSVRLMFISLILLMALGVLLMMGHTNDISFNIAGTTLCVFYTDKITRKQLKKCKESN